MSSSRKRKGSDSDSPSKGRGGGGSGFADLSPPPPRKKAKVELEPTRPPSRRIQQNKQKHFDELSKKAGPSSSKFDPQTDITPHLMAPLDPGADGRGYVSTPVRRDIERQMQRSVKQYPSLAKSNVPSLGRALRDEASKEGRTTKHVSTRGAHDGYRSGEDHTFTRYGVRPDGKRTSSDTPRPRSPSPDGSSRLSKGLRYEDSHQSAFRFTGLPGTTVHAPTQANQVVDSGLERFIDGHNDAFIHRQDTFTHSLITAARPIKGGQWETMQASYRRRRSPERSTSRSRSPSPEPRKVAAPEKGRKAQARPQLSAPQPKRGGRGGSQPKTGPLTLPKSSKGGPKGSS